MKKLVSLILSLVLALCVCTGALAAAFLDMPLRKAIPSIVAGVLTAGVVISIVTFGVSSLL